jgi:hypothetical protein
MQIGMRVAARERMKRTLVSEALRRAALIPFALGACGGAVAIPASGGPESPDGGGSSSGSGSGSSSGWSSTGGSSGWSSSSGVGSSSGGSSSSGAGSSSGSSGGSSSGSGGGCVLASKTPTGYGPCTTLYALAGDISACNPGSNGALSTAQCAALCPVPYVPALATCSVSESATMPPTLTCSGGPCQTGRRPEGLGVSEARHAGDARERYLAEMAWLEAASVPAFERLTRELEAHGAPRRLRDASRRAVGDEVRHAREVGAFAARAGAAVGVPRVAPLGVRSLEEIAIENAIEGCVRETFGAAVAAVQAARAGDDRFRAAMKGIARDEARHAQLSWEVATWLDEKLDDVARRRVKEARDRAADDLLRETSIEPDAVLARELGVPTSSEAVAMVRSLRTSLWS